MGKASKTSTVAVLELELQLAKAKEQEKLEKAAAKKKGPAVKKPYTRRKKENVPPQNGQDDTSEGTKKRAISVK